MELVIQVDADILMSLIVILQHSIVFLYILNRQKENKIRYESHAYFLTLMKAYILTATHTLTHFVYWVDHKVNVVIVMMSGKASPFQ